VFRAGLEIVVEFVSMAVVPVVDAVITHVGFFLWKVAKISSRESLELFPILIVVLNSSGRAVYNFILKTSSRMAFGVLSSWMQLFGWQVMYQSMGSPAIDRSFWNFFITSAYQIFDRMVLK
jgi:hypothetical protein